METQYISQKPLLKKKSNRLEEIYSRALLTRKVVLPITAIGGNLTETIAENIRFHYEARCVVEGFIKPGSTFIVTYSSGSIERGNQIAFEVVFECDVCFPVEGMIIQCVAKNITKAGIRAESAAYDPSPVVIFVAKDHHYNMSHFADVKEGDKIQVKVIGQRFELNDKYISIIGELVREKPFKTGVRPKARLVISDAL